MQDCIASNCHQVTIVLVCAGTQELSHRRTWTVPLQEIGGGSTAA